MFLERDLYRKEGASRLRKEGRCNASLQGRSKAEFQSISEVSKVLNLTHFRGQSWPAIPHKY